jgi:hypothetical protein
MQNPQAKCTHINKLPIVTVQRILICGECKAPITPWDYDRAQAHMYYLASNIIDAGLAQGLPDTPPLEENAGPGAGLPMPSRA